MRLKTEAVQRICAKCRKEAKAKGLPVECEVKFPVRDYKFCEKVYIYEIVDVGRQ